MESLIAQFMERYLSRQEIIHRLPVSISIQQFWPELEKERRKRSQELPLLDQNGKPFWFVLTGGIEKQCDAIAELARRDIAFTGPEFDALFQDAVVDEAVYSSVIEGAFTSREQAVDFIRQNKQPRNKSEQMVKNNYEALTYVLEHIDESITEQTIFDIYALVTKDTLEADVPTNAYRSESVFVQSSRGEIVHTAPEAEKVSGMMASLLEFITNNELSPLIKACIAHFYFVYVHPFIDGNGRTARALSFMMLLQAGYDFFRYFSISGVIAEERAKYYKAIKDVEDDDFDMTYFIDYYTGMLARAVKAMEERLVDKVVMEQTLDKLKAAGMNSRVIEGAKWILTSPNQSITIKAWQKKFGVVLETARQDLFKLEDAGIVHRKLVKRQYVFEVKK